MDLDDYLDYLMLKGPEYDLEAPWLGDEDSTFPEDDGSLDNEPDRDDD